MVSKRKPRTWFDEVEGAPQDDRIYHVGVPMKKTTRRNLLRFLGLGAAAAALAPSVGQAAPAEKSLTVDQARARIEAILVNPEKHPEIMAKARELMGTTTMTGDVTITTSGLTVSGPSFFGAKPVPVEEFDAMHRDAIANARADGYNRGREVESARWEARQAESFTIPITRPAGDKWMRSDLGGVVAHDMGAGLVVQHHAPVKRAAQLRSIVKD